MTDHGLSSARLSRLDDHLREYVDDGRLPGWHVQLARRGQVAHSTTYGLRDVEAGLPIATDTLYRIYSMTKPITSLAAMMLVEDAALDLNEPVATYIPEFADARVYVGGPATKPVTRPATEPVRVRHLLTHTSGLTYGFHHTHPTDEILRLRGYDLGVPQGTDLAAAAAAFAGMPLRFDPGTSWNYSVSTDVLGRVIEVASGRPFGQFLRTRILEPLGMHDTGFQAMDADRLAALYVPGPEGATRFDQIGKAALREPSWESGGGGLVSSMADYQRFVDLLAGEGEVDGVRLVSSRTLRYMASNHLPGGVDLADFGIPLYAETPFHGVGFGLGFSVTTNPQAAGVSSSVGEFGWGGMASTYFWVDPVEQLSVIFMTQLMPSSAYPQLRSGLKQLVYAALAD